MAGLFPVPPSRRGSSVVLSEPLPEAFSYVIDLLAMKALTVTSTDTETIADWPDKLQASKALGVSTKTIEKYVRGGQLEQRLAPQLNRPAKALINPRSIERIQAQRTALVPHSAKVPRTVPEGRREVLENRFWDPPIWMTESMAVIYSGLGAGYLSAAVEWKRIGPRGARVCRRSDLDKL